MKLWLAYFEVTVQHITHCDTGTSNCDFNMKTDHLIPTKRPNLMLSKKKHLLLGEFADSSES